MKNIFFPEKQTNEQESYQCLRSSGLASVTSITDLVSYRTSVGTTFLMFYYSEIRAVSGIRRIFHDHT